MTIPASHCEAVKLSYRQTKDGLVVSFAIHPNDMPDDLATAALGTRYMLALAKIGDDEKPVAGSQPTKSDKPGDLGQAPPAVKGKRSFADMAASQRSAILCGDPIFQEWISIRHQQPWDITVDEEYRKKDAANLLRKACGIHSRRELDTDDQALEKYKALETSYLVSVGRIAGPR